MIYLGLWAAKIFKQIYCYLKTSLKTTLFLDVCLLFLYHSNFFKKRGPVFFFQKHDIYVAVVLVHVEAKCRQNTVLVKTCGHLSIE